MDTAADCRIRATECLAYAKHEPEREVHLIGMAESWLRLAVQAERIEAMMDHARPVIPRNPNWDIS
jgi:hypothetical protein